MDYGLLNELDTAIEESILKLRNAKTGADVKVAILEYEELMYKREKEFVRLVMEERKSECEKQQPLIQTVEKDMSETKKKSHEALIWSFVALGVSILRIVLKAFGVT